MLACASRIRCTLADPNPTAHETRRGAATKASFFPLCIARQKVRLGGNAGDLHARRVRSPDYAVALPASSLPN
jgi:hypothetical protein